MLLAALSGTGQARHRQCMNAAPAKNAAGPLSGAWQARHRQCMSAAPAKNAAGQDRQKLNMIIKKRAPVNRFLYKVCFTRGRKSINKITVCR